VSREPATLLILAGGESKRMGFPKHELVVGDRDILSHVQARLGSLFVETLIVGRDLTRAPHGTRAVGDRLVARSPLVGLHAGLAASRTDLCFAVACDMPSVEPRLVDFLLAQATGVDAVVPVIRGHHEPLLAAYRITCVGPIERLVLAGRLKVSDLFDVVRTRRVMEADVLPFDPSLRSIENVNVASEADRVSTSC